LRLAVTVETRLTRRFGLTHPILSAPIPFIAGGWLAAAVTYAGGLGVIGGGHWKPARGRGSMGAAMRSAVGRGWALHAQLAGSAAVLIGRMESTCSTTTDGMR
jgi:nitronate monooxygenase